MNAKIIKRRKAQDAKRKAQDAKRKVQNIRREGTKYIFII
jgi:hypothetical protein